MMTNAEKFVETLSALCLSTMAAVGLVIYLHSGGEPRTKVISLVVAIVAGSFWLRVVVFTAVRMATATRTAPSPSSS